MAANEGVIGRARVPAIALDVRLLGRPALVVAAAAICWASTYLLPLYSPSERLHAIIPCVWLIDLLVYDRAVLRTPRGYAVITGAVGVFFLTWFAIWLQASSLHAGYSAGEVFWWFIFLASLAILYSRLCRVLTFPLSAWPRAASLLRSPGGWRWRYLRAFVALMLFLPYLFTACNIHRFKIGNVTDPAKAYHLSYQNVAFRSIDGIPLSGWFIPSDGSDRAVVLCHGIGANKANFLSIAPFLHRAGYNVFLFDLRGHGDSGGHTTSFGYYEARDVRAAVETVAARPGIKHIAAYGFSMGASALLHAMPEMPNVEAVIVDSTFAELSAVSAHQMGFLPSIVRDSLLSTLGLWSGMEAGVPMQEISPNRHIGVIGPRPLLIMHGLADTLINSTQARANYRAAHQPKELWLVPRAGHLEASQLIEKEYQHRVLEFLKRSLPQKEGRRNYDRRLTDS